MAGGDLSKVAGLHLKEEVYVLGGLLALRVLEGAIVAKDHFPPFGLVDRAGKPIRRILVAGKGYAWHIRLAQSLATTLSYTMKQIIPFEGGPNAESLDPIARRFKQLVNGSKIFTSTEPAEVLKMGAGTGANIMAYTLKVIPDVYRAQLKSKPSAEQLILIARNSYGIINQLTSVYLWALAEIGPLLKTNENTDEFDPSSFVLEEVRGQHRLAFTSQTKKMIGDQNREMIAAYEPPLIGCLARTDLGSGSAVDLLWEWVLEVGEQVYRDLDNTHRLESHDF